MTAAPRPPRFARRSDLGLTRTEFAVLDALRTPQRIQAFVSALPINHEQDGETMLSVRGVLRERHAHCLEAALLSACALWIHGTAPLLMHLDCTTDDYPHVVALFKAGECWGAISKSNGALLRHRDPVYRSLRELAMSYFHEYCNRRGDKTLRSYSRPWDVRSMRPELWVTNAGECSQVNDRLAALAHYPLVTRRQTRAITRRDRFERGVGKIPEYPAPKARRR